MRAEFGARSSASVIIMIDLVWSGSTCDKSDGEMGRGANATPQHMILNLPRAGHSPLACSATTVVLVSGSLTKWMRLARAINFIPAYVVGKLEGAIRQHARRL